VVFSNDVLFLHIQKTGGTSVTEYLLQTLTPPVYYMGGARNHLHIQRAGLTQLPGRNHGTLKEAKAVVREYGFELDRFPVIMAALRNPYDLAVSAYAYRRQPVLCWTMLEPNLASKPRVTSQTESNYALAEVITSLARGKVARIEPIGDESIDSLRESLLIQAVHLGRRVSVRKHEGALYVSLDVRDRKSYVGVSSARSHEFRDFMALTAARKRTLLSKLKNYFFLDGAMPPTMRVLRFERLGDDVREVLRSIGIDENVEFPWLNRSDHGEYTSYYDRESERLVYEQCRWIFEQGHYQRLPFGSVAAEETERIDALEGRT
jgi:hypothetical protein